MGMDAAKWTRRPRSTLAAAGNSYPWLSGAAVCAWPLDVPPRGKQRNLQFRPRAPNLPEADLL
jgi:hypothetical protein